jgi:uncharacterized protein YhbP (UPF0306 family)
MSNVVREQALIYLRDHHVMSLATIGSHGIWSAALFYASQEFNLIFLSAGHTRHAQNITTHPRIAATIQENYQNWEEIKGIQLEGIAQHLQDKEREAAIKLYTARFAFLQQADSVMKTSLNKVNWYRIIPDKLYFIDNSQGLGHRTEVHLSS